MSIDLDVLASRYMTGGGRLLKKPTLEYIAALEAAARERDGLREALAGLVTAVTYADPPKMMNGVLAHEARVPVEFITIARQSLAPHAGETK